MKKVKISCKYYLVQCTNRQRDELKCFDLLDWIDKVREKPYKEILRNIKDVEGRVESLKHRDKSKIYALNFMRMNEYSSSFKVKNDKPAEHINIEVEDGEYIGKNTVCLYDAENGIIMIQTNREGYSNLAIQRYINSFYESEVCELTPIIKNLDILNGGKDYKKIDVRFANINNFHATSGTWFESIVEGINEVEGINVHIEISCGKNRNHILRTDKVKTAIHDILENKECISSANVTMADEEIVGIYKLFDNICNESIEYTIEKNGGISFEKLFAGMYERYITYGERENVINALYGEK